MDNNGQSLTKTFGFWDSLAIIIAIVIGVGIFRVPSEVSRYLSSPNLIILAWLAGGVVSLLGSLCYAELSASFPETGGNYIYLRESYGPLTGFLFGWTELLVIRTGSIAAMSFIFAEYLQSFSSLDKSLIKPVAILSILMLSFINMVGTKYGKGAQDIFIIPKILSIVVIIILGIMSGKGDISHFHSTAYTGDKSIFLSFGLALIPILWTYGGWHENTFMAGETKNAARTVPAALISGVFVVTALYLAMNFVYMYLIPVKEIANTDLVAADALQILYGKSGRKILEGLVMIFALGCTNAMIMTGSRVTYAMARDNAVFRYIGEVNSKYGTPHRAIILNAIWSVVLIVLGNFNQLLFFTGTLVWLFFALVVIGLFVLRHKFPNIERPYKVWGYPFLPAAFIFICIALFVSTLAFYTFQSLIGLCILISGIPIFAISQKKSGHKHKNNAPKANC